MNDNGDGLFKLLAEGLTAEQRSDFFQALREASITGHDAELAKLLRALQLYKDYYDSILTAVLAAADRVERIRQDFFPLSERTAHQVEAVSHLAEQLILEAGQIHQTLTTLRTAVEEVIQESAGRLASQIDDLLRTRIEDTVLCPLQERLLQVVNATKALNESAARSKDAASALRQEARLARRLHISVYALAGVIITGVLILGSWFSLHSWYSQRIEQERLALIQKTEKHREILLKLARSDRTLELVQDWRPGKCLLVMKNAVGWQSSSHQGVIEFNE
jgi:hypothetical protein